MASSRLCVPQIFVRIMKMVIRLLGTLVEIHPPACARHDHKYVERDQEESRNLCAWRRLFFRPTASLGLRKCAAKTTDALTLDNCGSPLAGLCTPLQCSQTQATASWQPDWRLEGLLRVESSPPSTSSRRPIRPHQAEISSSKLRSCFTARTPAAPLPHTPPASSPPSR